MGGRNLIGSFSYNLKDLDTIESVEKEAAKLNISFSEYVVRTLKAAVAGSEEKNGEALERLPILNGEILRQTSINEYDVKLFQPSDQRMMSLKGLDKDQLTKVAIDTVHLKNQIEIVRRAK